MGELVIVTKYDDTDPSVAADRTVSFDWEGKPLEIDLSEPKYQELRAFIEPYLKVARKRESGAKSKPRAVTTKPAEIRAWAKRNGWDVGVRGHLPIKAVEEFHQYGGKDKVEFSDPDPTPADREWNDLDDAERDSIKEWVTGLGYSMPRAAKIKDRIVAEAWGDHNEELLKEILLG